MRLPTNRQGFTLLEIMISMLILAIAFLALIAVQLGALNGYISARDNTEATDLARRTAELLRVHAMGWRTGPLGNGSSIYNNTAGPFDSQTPHQQIAGANGGWVTLADAPVDVRFNRRTPTDTTHVGGKFCIFARGQAMGGATAGGAWQYQIAVVYPGPNAVLLDCSDYLTNVGLASPGTPGAVPAYELAGYRAVFHGTVIVRQSGSS